MKVPNDRQKIVILGDSTIDNRVWLDLEPVQLFLGRKSPLLSAIIDFIGKHNPFKSYSVVENLRRQMPEVEFIDRTNDGFTTTDVLQGAMKNKVFGIGAHRFFPHEPFYPLRTDEIEKADHIILSVGGNNFREFIQASLNMYGPAIQLGYSEVFRKLLSEYKEILKAIVKRNPNANIILMTQYYPAINQKMLINSSIYDFMAKLGALLKTGNAEKTIIDVMKKTYNGILKFIAEDEAMRNIKFSVVDITSSLNPNLSENFVGQIEPSGKGGAHIAQMLAYTIKHSNSDNTPQIYRFAPDFFTANRSQQSHVYTHAIASNATFSPVPPSSMARPLYKGQSRAIAIGGTLLLGATTYFSGFGLISACVTSVAGWFLGKKLSQAGQIGYQAADRDAYHFETAGDTSNSEPTVVDLEMKNFGARAAKEWLPYLKSTLPFSGAYNNKDFDHGYEQALKQPVKLRR